MYFYFALGVNHVGNPEDLYTPYAHVRCIFPVSHLLALLITLSVPIYVMVFDWVKYLCGYKIISVRVKWEFKVKLLLNIERFHYF